MIVDLFLDVVFGVASFVLGLLPDWNVPALTLGEVFSGSVGTISWVLPVDALLTCLGVLAAWWAFCVGFDVVVWVLRALHILGD